MGQESEKQNDHINHLCTEIEGLLGSEKLKEALLLSTESVNSNPENHRIRLAYARSLAANSYFSLASRELYQLYQSFPENWVLKKLIQKISPQLLVDDIEVKFHTNKKTNEKPEEVLAEGDIEIDELDL